MSELEALTLPAEVHSAGDLVQEKQLDVSWRQKLVGRLGQQHGNAYVQRLLGADRLQRVAGETTADPAADETTAIDVTGRYEAIEPGGTNRITIQINQAGQYFSGYWQRRRLGSGQQTISHYRLEGELIDSAADNISFRFTRTHVARDESYSGHLTARRAGNALQLHMATNQWSHDFRQTSTQAAVSDEALENVPAEARELATAHERAPLDSQEEGALEGFADIMKDKVRRYLALDAGIERTSEASGINQYVREQLRPFGSRQSQGEQMPLVRLRLREHLSDPLIASGNVARPPWDWLQIMVLSDPNFTQDIQALFGMAASGEGVSADSPQHRYRWRFRVVGLAGDVGIGLGGFLGAFDVEKLGSDGWSESYFTVMGQASGGLSAGITVGVQTAWSELSTPFNWTSGNFEGSYSLGGVAAAVAVVGGGGGGSGFIVFRGDGTFPELGGDASGFMAILGLYIGGELSTTHGYMWGGEEEAVRNAPRPQDEADPESSYETGESIHFPVDDPSLTDAGRQAIRAMVAEHRALLTTPGSAIQIDGYTSTTGRPERNQPLSELRAQNTMQAIRDLLGPDLAVANDAIQVTGHGEEPALRAGEPDESENVDWRRVDVRLNGSIVLTLR
ncbi:MAG: OmpA family protein [Anaerolineales bacterium]|nr:OmpA family protein [Anaerolineales bacterium]